MTDTSVFSLILRKIITLWFFVGHCMADDLFDHFFERDLGLDSNLLLALGINGPNVNKSFKSKLAAELQKRSATSFLVVGTCLEGIKCLKDNVNADQFANYLQREEKIIEVCRSNRCDNALYYKTLPNPIEQYKNLKEYFLKALSTLPGFKGKNEINQTECYQRIKNILTSKTAFAYMSFIVHVCQDFKEFVVSL